MLNLSRKLSATVLAFSILSLLGACSNQEESTEETVQTSEQETPAEAPADEAAVTPPNSEVSETDKALAEASSTDFSDPSQVQLNDSPVAATETESPVAVAEPVAPAAEAPIADAIDTSIPAPVAPDLMSDTAALTSNSSVYFAKSSARLNKEARSVLKDLAVRMKADKNLKVVLSGHCDNRGSAAFNRRLANKRAKAAKQYLVKLGIKSRQISFGKPQLAQAGQTEEEHAQNRRVEIEVQ